MKIKTTLRPYFTSVGMARISKTRNTKCWREVSSTARGTANCPAFLQISVENPQKPTKKSPIRPSYTALWHLPNGLNNLFHRSSPSHVCCCSGHSSLRNGNSYLSSIDEWTVKKWQHTLWNAVQLSRKMNSLTMQADGCSWKYHIREATQTLKDNALRHPRLLAADLQLQV